MSIVDISDSFESFTSKRMHCPDMKLSTIVLTVVDEHYIVLKNLYAITSILSQVFTREDVFAGESRKFREREGHA